MSKRKITRTTIIDEYRLEVGRAELRQALRAIGHDVPGCFQAYVRVPGGGDWSNTNLEIGEEVNVIVEWTETNFPEDIVEEL